MRFGAFKSFSSHFQVKTANVPAVTAYFRGGGEATNDAKPPKRVDTNNL